MIKIQINKTNIKETNNIYLGVSAQFQIEKSFKPIAQVVLTEEREKSGEINRHLVQNGVMVNSLETKTDSLED